ncbi:hypothetical protein P6U16_04740 [Rhizobium sp. 32-5/1]|uniref:hypothetical protein n=1 Tax=Rhizobium sp. 32-5/1 TaxID=3019602 RepID=UPI00240E339D|nr:hypothetical protein [Rhizobium sp. 32-5/1]WEZ84029.1 hypothetical protein P6U16_04740 [Rhizobium sp. 32-5/1]
MILAAMAVIAGGLFTTLKVPNTRGVERILASYRADPQATLKRLETAVFQCVPESADSPVGMKLTGTVIVPFYVKALDLRMKGATRDAFGAELQKWIVAHHPKLLTDLPDKDFLELFGYLKRIGEDDVENCILSPARRDDGGTELRTNTWDLRL